ncbi:MAG: ribosome maturation factor RimP [Firmicutes bacterium]|nr:ribosome maturation factor RimP [Bacillota bacterium]
MAGKKIEELIASWMQEYEKTADYELSRTEFVKEGADWYLRVYVDKVEGEGYGIMGTDDCEAISRYLSAKLDEADPIKQNYYLEVSSPGMDRPLITEKDFRRFIGSLIEIKLYKALDGSKFYTGTLTGYDNGAVTIEDAKGKAITLQQNDAAKINLAVVF